jgi:hypothetical protein
MLLSHIHKTIKSCISEVTIHTHWEYTSPHHLWPVEAFWQDHQLQLGTLQGDVSLRHSQIAFSHKKCMHFTFIQHSCTLIHTHTTNYNTYSHPYYAHYNYSPSWKVTLPPGMEPTGALQSPHTWVMTTSSSYTGKHALICVTCFYLRNSSHATCASETVQLV